MVSRDFQKIRDEDCVEAEIVSGPGAGSDTSGTRPRRERPDGYAAPHPKPVNIPFYGLFRKIRSIFVVGALLLGFGSLFLGIILTSTVIGAIIGIPLLILGGLCLWLVFKLLGQKAHPINFRRF
jgi:hypothetical protein